MTIDRLEIAVRILENWDLSQIMEHQAGAGAGAMAE
jgi:hypothetical protein